MAKLSKRAKVWADKVEPEKVYPASEAFEPSVSAPAPSSQSLSTWRLIWA